MSPVSTNSEGLSAQIAQCPDLTYSQQWQCQAIIWTDAGILLIGPLRTNFGEILIEITYFHSRKYMWICRKEIAGHFDSASMS